MSSAAVSDGRACRVYALVQLHAVDGGEARRPRTARPETHHAVRKTRPITVLRRSSAADGTRTVDTMDAVITPQRGRSPHVLCAVRRETLRLAAALVIPVMTARLAIALVPHGEEIRSGGVTHAETSCCLPNTYNSMYAHLHNHKT